MDFIRANALGVALLTGLTVNGAVLAAEGCYATGRYPSVYGLSVQQGHLHATLPVPPDQPREADMQINHDLVQGGDGAWQVKSILCTDSDCFQPARISATCPYEVPRPNLTFDEIKRISPEMAEDMDPSEIEQQVGACVQQGTTIWFGITFYCGEGYCGLGGIGRYDTQTHKMEVRRPKALLNASVSPLAFDGKYLWAGTYDSGECIGEDPVSGLVRYDWAADQLVSFAAGTDSGGDPGPCGFRFNDLYVDKQGLWISSDMGLALLSDPQDAPATMHWTNYIPDPQDAKQALRETDCTTLYAGLLKTLPKQRWGASEYESYYQQFSKVLKRFNPALAQKLIVE